MTPTPSPTEARERLKAVASGIDVGAVYIRQFARRDNPIQPDDAMRADLSDLLAREEALVGALRELCLVLRLAALKYGFDLTGSASMESADAILNPDPIPETAEGDA